MTSLIGIPVIVAAWAVPALFLCLLGGLIAGAFLRPVYRAWGLAFDVIALSRAAGGALFLATACNAFNVFRIARHAYP